MPLTFKPVALRALAEVIGWAEDFWHDPAPQTKSASAAKASVVPPADVEIPRSLLNSWSADRPQILEKLWGEGEAAPGGDYLNKMLVAPFGLKADDSVLDLAAGLGSLPRMLASKFNVYVNGLESDPQLAARGMELSVRLGKAKHAPVAAYDLSAFQSDTPYQCVLARELFYRVADKQGFFAKLAAATKPQGQIAFTDYVLEADARDKLPVLEWLGFEAGAAPLSQGELGTYLKTHGFDLRVADDQTGFFQTEILHGLAKFAQFLRQNQPDEQTRILVKAEIELWARRQAALASGLKLVRFHGIKG